MIPWVVFTGDCRTVNPKGLASRRRVWPVCELLMNSPGDSRFRKEAFARAFRKLGKVSQAETDEEMTKKAEAYH